MKFKLKTGLNVKLWELARVGILDEYEIYIHIDDPGKIPHFHIWDYSTRGKKFHTCIRIDSPKYFHHTGKEDILNSKDKKDLCEFLQSKPRNKRFNTYWELLVDTWNLNNSDIEINENTEMPNYRLLGV